jgi:succinate dehydrogenase/fumarate reductase flavoprotein subunit
VVVGSGAAGLVAAITAAVSGCKVIVLEKTEFFGGTTAWSGGAAWVPNNHLMWGAGVADSYDDAYTYMKSIVGKHFDEEMAQAFLSNAPKMLEFLEQHTTALRFASYPGPDYHQDAPGAMKAARSVLPKPFDGKLLGPYLPVLRRPLKELVVFGGMQVDVMDLFHLQHCHRSLASFRHCVKLVGRYFLDRLRYSQGTRLIRGNALAGRLLRAALDLDITLWSKVVAKELVVEEDRVTGIVVSRGGEDVQVVASRGVILATGGFAANEAMRKQLIPFPDSHWSMLPVGNVGDGINLATSIGASHGRENASNGFWTPVSILKQKTGGVVKYPHLAFDRCKPGSVIVNRQGKRFVNEAASYQQVVNSMHTDSAVPAYLIADHAFLRKHGMGLARPWPYPYRKFVKTGYLVEAPTLDALAEELEISPDGLRLTVAQMNEYAKTGVDKDFARGADIYTRSLGDAENKPNPCLGTLEEAPFYAVRLYPGDVGTAYGLLVNPNAQVLNAEGKVIAGLYACGLDMNSVMRGTYPSAGSMHGPNMTFGYLAGRHVAQRAEVQRNQTEAT